MSLTNKDFARIEELFDRKLEPIFGKLTALRNDIKEIYTMLFDLNKRIDQKSILNPAFTELTDKEQLLRLNDILLSTAQRLGVDLPR